MRSNADSLQSACYDRACCLVGAFCLAYVSEWYVSEWALQPGIRNASSELMPLQLCIKQASTCMLASQLV